jgi:hypothetical protein
MKLIPWAKSFLMHEEINTQEREMRDRRKSTENGKKKHGSRAVNTAVSSSS